MNVDTLATELLKILASGRRILTKDCITCCVVVETHNPFKWAG